MGLGGRPEPSQGAEKLINRPSGDGGGGSVLQGSRTPEGGLAWGCRPWAPPAWVFRWGPDPWTPAF